MASLLYVLSRTESGAVVVANVADSALSKLPRGIRNNNPGNIEWIPEPAKRWRGMYESDGRFGVFDTPANGVRAIGKELLLDYSRGVRTVYGLISNWAPAHENNTLAYAKSVGAPLGLATEKAVKEQTIDVRANLGTLVAGIIKHENGVQPYPLSDVSRWALTA